MAKNTGKSSEKIFERTLDSLGKRACYFRLVDASEITGRTGKVAISARAQPSDYIVTLDGETFYAEVKSTINPTSFPFSMIKTPQSAAAKRLIASGGRYMVFVHNLLTDTWYVFPYSLILETEKASLKWEELESYKWQVLSTT